MGIASLQVNYIGVLENYIWYMMKLVNKYYDLFGARKHKVRRLEKIVKKTGAKIVISSSWRYGWYAKYEDKCSRQK